MYLGARGPGTFWPGGPQGRNTRSTVHGGKAPAREMWGLRDSRDTVPDARLRDPIWGHDERGDRPPPRPARMKVP